MPKYFPYLLIFSMMAGALEIDLALPSFPDIAEAFAVSEEVVERIISLNFLGFCLSALWYGPLSDHFGRRPVMMFGAVLFCVGSLGCAYSSTIEMMLLCRFVQGLGASASFVTVFTMISDVYRGSEATHWIGTLNAILTAVMAGAPILGGLLNAFYGWKGCYTCIALLSGSSLLFIAFLLPETRLGQKVRFKDVINDYKTLLRSRRFLHSAGVPVLISGGYMAFVSVIPFLYRNGLGMPLKEYSFHQAVIIASFSVASYYAEPISAYFGQKRAVMWGLLATVAATSALFVLACLFTIPPLWLTTPLMSVFSATCAVAFAVVFAASLEAVPGKNGPASSLLMSMRTLFCAVTIQLAGVFYDGRLLPTAAIVAVCCFFSYVLAIDFYRTKERLPSQGAS